MFGRGFVVFRKGTVSFAMPSVSPLEDFEDMMVFCLIAIAILVLPLGLPQT